MKKTILLACMGFVCAVSSPVFAGPQQERMKSCNAEAKGMHGDERKAFMKKCLSGNHEQKPAAANPAEPATPAQPAAASAQQDKMKMCNADAKGKGLAGAERKAFMSSCLKG